MDILDILTLWHPFEITVSAEPTTTLHLTITASRASNRLFASRNFYSLTVARDSCQLFATRSQLAVIAHRESNEVDV